MKVAAIQMLSGESVDANFARAKDLLAESAEKNVDIAVLPENFLTYGQKSKPPVDEQRSFLHAMTDLAKTLNIWLIAGSYPLNAVNVPGMAEENTDAGNNVKPYAASVVVDSVGEVQGAYLKIHLFDALVGDSVRNYRESDEFSAGREVKAFDSPFGCFGVSVCYDLRFPELYTKLAGKGCEVIFIPSAFTEVTGRAHWETLLRARAIESQCYIVAANQGGKHEKGRSTWGHSMIIDPWGTVLSHLEFGEGVLVETLDMAFLHELRKKMPVQQHRKLI